MSEFYLVLSGEHREIETLVEANTIRDGLARHMPGKTFKVYRCKKSLRSAKHVTKMIALLRDIDQDGLTPANADRLTVLLTTLRIRTPKFEALTLPAKPLPLVDHEEHP